MTENDFVFETETFEDAKILRYQVPGFERLSLRQKLLVYYLAQAGLSGRDVIYEQKHRFGLAVRKAVDAVFERLPADQRVGQHWEAFVRFAKLVWLSNGTYHTHNRNKHNPAFDRAWFVNALKASNAAQLPDNVLDYLFDPTAEPLHIDDAAGVAAVNFYAPGISVAEAKAFYASLVGKNTDESEGVEVGINTRLERGADGKLFENVIKVGGLYGPAMEQIVFWLKKAITVAENDPQKHALELLVRYFQEGDPKLWKEYSIAWVQATEGDVDYILGFVEVYEDPLARHGTYESIVQVNDVLASEKMKVLSTNAAWFEANAPLFEQHKKKDVRGISYKMINVASEAGDASPCTPIGVNLPNPDFIRARYGSKSVSLCNIEHAYKESKGKGLLQEFCLTEEEIERASKYAAQSDQLHTCLHEVLGHASGCLEPGVSDPKSTLGHYYNVLEEARADLFALYYILDPKLVELGLIPSLEVGKAEYESYIRNGLLVQLTRIKAGQQLEEAHMRNRQLISSWCFQHGLKDDVIRKVQKDGKTFYSVQNFDRLRGLFGDLLREVQRIKSTGDGEAGKALVENYGVRVDRAEHDQVLERFAKLNLKPFAGFINAELVPVRSASGDIEDVRVEYPTDFAKQHLHYAKTYSFL